MASKAQPGSNAPEAFAHAFSAEYPALHRYLHRRLGREAADELAAETFATAYRSWERFDRERPLRPWLYGIATNLARHHWRSERRKLRAYARSGIDPVTPDADLEAIGRVDARALNRELASALAALRPAERDVLLLHAWAELSDAEIAAALSVPIGTVKSRLHRCRERMRNSIAPVGQEPDVTTPPPIECPL